jgi:hypothetical protein
MEATKDLSPLELLEKLINEGLELPEALWRVCKQFPLLSPEELTAEYDQIN